MMYELQQVASLLLLTWACTGLPMILYVAAVDFGLIHASSCAVLIPIIVWTAIFIVSAVLGCGAEMVIQYCFEKSK